MSYLYVGFLARRQTAELPAADGGFEIIHPIFVKWERDLVLALGHSDI